MKFTDPSTNTNTNTNMNTNTSTNTNTNTKTNTNTNTNTSPSTNNSTSTSTTLEKNVGTFSLDLDLLNLLERLELTELSDIFAREELTMKDVLDMNDDELKSVGIPLFKQRKAIMRECQDINKEKGKLGLGKKLSNMMTGNK